MQINFAQPYIVIGQSILLKKIPCRPGQILQRLNNAKYTVGSKLGTTGEQAPNA